MKKIVALVGVALLSGCATVPPPPPRVQVVVQKEEVPVPCVAAADVPARPAPLGPRPDNISQALDLAVAKVRELEIYVGIAAPLLEGCKKL